MKKIVLILALVINFAIADKWTVSGTVLYKSGHGEGAILPADQTAWNEDNRGLGFAVYYSITEKFKIGPKWAQYENSYWTPTNDQVTTMYGFSAMYELFEAYSLKFGGQVFVGRQTGYEAKGFFLGRCDEGDTCKSNVAIPALFVGWQATDNIALVYQVTGMPGVLWASELNLEVTF